MENGSVSVSFVIISASLRDAGVMFEVMFVIARTMMIRSHTQYASVLHCTLTSSILTLSSIFINVLKFNYSLTMTSLTLLKFKSHKTLHK